jgi:hypothetical protein
LAIGSSIVTLIIIADKEAAIAIVDPDDLSGLIDPDLEDNIPRICRATSALNKEDSPPPTTQKAMLSAALLAA